MNFIRSSEFKNEMIPVPHQNIPTFLGRIHLFRSKDEHYYDELLKNNNTHLETAFINAHGFFAENASRPYSAPRGHAELGSLTLQ